MNTEQQEWVGHGKKFSPLCTVVTMATTGAIFALLCSFEWIKTIWRFVFHVTTFLYRTETFRAFKIEQMKYGNTWCFKQLCDTTKITLIILIYPLYFFYFSVISIGVGRRCAWYKSSHFSPELWKTFSYSPTHSCAYRDSNVTLFFSGIHWHLDALAYTVWYLAQGRAGRLNGPWIEFLATYRPLSHLSHSHMTLH